MFHLHRRAGFAATWGEIQRDLRDGPEVSVTRLVQGKSRIDGTVKDFETVSAALADSASSTAAADRLKAWWVFRMLFSPDPLGERLTLLWHNHFATSNLKVNDLAAMRRQNEVLRQFARAPFGDLLRHVIKDPAMLDWLDAPANRKEHPNENLARESMELFTIGVGNFSETDVKEAARALTGWSFKPDGFHEFLQYHDSGEKTILGRKGRWRGDDFVSMLLEQPATSVRLAKRLCEMFMGEAAATPEHLQDLAKGLREHQLDVGWAVERILRSQTFFADPNLRSQIVGAAGVRNRRNTGPRANSIRRPARCSWPSGSRGWVRTSLSSQRLWLARRTELAQLAGLGGADQFRRSAGRRQRPLSGRACECSRVGRTGRRQRGGRSGNPIPVAFASGHRATRLGAKGAAIGRWNRVCVDRGKRRQAAIILLSSPEAQIR